MCIVSQSQLIDNLTARARLTILELKKAPKLANTAGDLEQLLENAIPLIAPLAKPRREQITAHALVGYEIRMYPSLLERVVGPPLGVGPEPLLGYVAAECALAALRQGESQAAMSAIFLGTLCASRLEEPAEEALHHLLVESSAEGFIGLFEIGGWRTGTPRDDLLALQRRQGMKFVTTAVQIRGTFGGASAMNRPETSDP